MFIEQITLQNIKSYGTKPTTIQFKEGINLIAGANGAGKSTILEAIGFVLFDALPYSQGDFERRGKSGAAKVVIRLQSSYDNRVYDIERSIPARYKVMDVKDNIDEGIQSKDDLQEWLCQHLKVENKEDLKSLFINAVGVQQGTITSIFMTTPSNRKETFDALLRVQDFNQAWDQLGETRKYISELLSEKTRQTIHKQGQTEHLSKLEADAEESRKTINDKINGLTELSSWLEELRITLIQLEQQKLVLDELNHEIDKAKPNIESLESLIKKAQDDLKKSQEAQEIIQVNQDAYELYREALNNLKVLEEQRKQRDLLNKEMQATQKKVDSFEQRINQLKRELRDVETSESRVVELQPMVEKQEQLEKAQNQAYEQQKERDRIRQQLDKDIELHDSIEGQLYTLSQRVEQRQQITEQLEELSQVETQFSEQIDELYSEYYRLEKDLNTIQEAFNSTAAKFEEYNNLQQSIERQQLLIAEAESNQDSIILDLEKREIFEQKIKELDEQITQVIIQKTSAENNLPRISRELTELQNLRAMVGEEGAVCPVCRRNMDEGAHDEALSYYDNQEQNLINERMHTSEKISELEGFLYGWQPEKVSLEAERDALANQVALKSIQEKISELKNGFTKLQISLEKEKDVPQNYSDAEIALNDARNVFNQFGLRIEELKAKRTEKIEQISKLNQQIAALPSQDELQHRQAEYNTLVEAIRSAEVRLHKLDNIDNVIQELKNELLDLDNPREKQAIAQNTANKREILTTEYEEWQSTFENATAELEIQQAKLQAFENLDRDLEVILKQRDETFEGYQLCIENKQIADLLSEREKQLANIKTELTEAIEHQDSLVRQHISLTENFDINQYEALSQERNELETERTKLSTQIEGLNENLSKLDEQIEGLKAIAQEIQELQIQAGRIEEEQQIFEFIRRSIRDAGPRIRKRKVQLVSEVAANYFSEIIHDFTMRLYWDADDYSISIEQSGEKRPFTVLSGGEQMVAALSVRLALLINMTRIRLIFLDEPTINLDENRRIQLAERLQQIDGLRQLFVISHDDTFIGGSNHVINVIKDEGVSRVEMSHAPIQ